MNNLSINSKGPFPNFFEDPAASLKRGKLQGYNIAKMAKEYDKHKDAVFNLEDNAI